MSRDPVPSIFDVPATRPGPPVRKRSPWVGYICFTLSALLALVTLLLVFADTAHAGTNACTVTNEFIYPAGKKAKFTVTGECTVSLVSYQLHGGGALKDQTLHDATTATLAAGDHELTVEVPECEYQTDLVIGQPRPTAYGYPAGSVLAWRFGGNGECQVPTTTTPSTTTPPSTTTTTSLTTTTSASPTPTLPGSTTTVLVGPASSEFPTSPTPTEELAQSGFEWGWLGLVGLGVIALGQVTKREGRRRA